MTPTRKLPSRLLDSCRRLRFKQTSAENILWRFLRRHQLFGFKFRRQHPLRGYILDFYCSEASLAIELDGGGHADESQRLHDERRTKHLNWNGLTVLRFWNADVYNNLEGVLLRIAEHLPDKHPPP